MQVALDFWYGIHNLDIIYQCYCSRYEMHDRDLMEAKTEILQAHLDDSRPHIATIATVELLPTKAWRRALWFYNIDFMSEESFLRRLSAEQAEGLEITRQYLERQEAPPCFTEGFKNRVRRFFSTAWANVERIVSTNAKDEAVRHELKHAMAYEFFYLDFGFALYRRENDEETIAGSLAKRFVQKADKEDPDTQKVFVVNQEDGAYWWMYLNIRSNPVWFPNRKVQLKPAICPGFWYTLLGWFFFLGISPAALVSAGALLYTDASPWLFLATAAVGAFTPTILLLLFFKFGLVKLGHYITSRIEVNEEYWQVTLMGMTFMVVGSLLGVVTVGVGHMMYAWMYHSVLLAVYFTVVLFLLGAYILQSVHEETLLPFSAESKLIMLPALLFAVGKTLFDFHLEIWAGLVWMVSGLIENWLQIVMFAGLIGTVGLIVWPIYLMDKWERRAWKGDKKADAKLNYAYKIGSAVTIIIVAASVPLFAYIFSASPMTLNAALGYLLVLVIVGGYGWYVQKHSPRHTQSIGKALSLTKTDWWDSWDSWDDRGKYLKQIMIASTRNAWLLAQPDYTQKMRRLVAFIENHFTLKQYPSELLQIDAKGFAYLQAYNQYFFDRRINTDLKVKYVQHMLKGVGVGDAQMVLERWKARMQQRTKSLELLYGKTLGPVVNLTVGLVVKLLTAGGAVFRFLFKTIADLHSMWKTFNENRCPMWSKPPQVNIDK